MSVFPSGPFLLCDQSFVSLWRSSSIATSPVRSVSSFARHLSDGCESLSRITLSCFPAVPFLLLLFLGGTPSAQDKGKSGGESEDISIDNNKNVLKRVQGVTG